MVPDREAKSISNETTFAADIDDPELLRAWLAELVDQTARRLRRHELKGRTVDIKVRFADFKTITRSQTLARATNITQELLEAGLELLTERLPKHRLPVRLLGFGVTGFDHSGTTQRHLFDEPEREKRKSLDDVADKIAAKFGKAGLRRGTRPED